MRPVFDLWEVFMERIDRLITKAKKAAQAKAERFIVGFVTYDPDKGKYKADGGLWNGKKGGGRSVITYHNTPEDALNCLQALTDEYPNTIEDAVIFIDDIED